MSSSEESGDSGPTLKWAYCALCNHLCEDYWQPVRCSRCVDDCRSASCALRAANVPVVVIDHILGFMVYPGCRYGRDGRSEAAHPVCERGPAVR